MERHEHASETQSAAHKVGVKTADTTLDRPNALESWNLSLDRPNALESMYGRCDAAATIKDLDRPNVLESRYGSWNKAVTKTAKSELNGALEQRACDHEGRHTIQGA